MRITAESVIEAAVANRKGCPIRQPSPKKSPSPNSPTTASLPCSEVTAILILPLAMQKTESAVSPCENMTCSLRYSDRVRPLFTVARNVSGSNDAPLAFRAMLSFSNRRSSIALIGGAGAVCGAPDKLGEHGHEDAALGEH